MTPLHRYKGGKDGDASIQSSKKQFPQDIKCDVQFNPSDIESSDYAQITVKSFILPILFFIFCSILAMILQISHQKKVKRGGESIWDRNSQLSLVSSESKSKRSQTLARANKKLRNDDDDSDFDRNDLAGGDNARDSLNVGNDKPNKRVIRFKDEGQTEGSSNNQPQSPLHLDEEDGIFRGT